MEESEKRDHELNRGEDQHEPTRFNLFLRKMLRWSTGVLAIFVLGIVLTWVVQVSPRIQEINEFESKLESASQELDDLASTLETLRQVDAENLALQNTLEERQIHFTLLSILVDVSNAQFALLDNNTVTAQAALAETDTKIEFLVGELGDDQESLDAMQERLTLAIDEMDEDVFAALSDLEVLRNSILALERSLFGE